MLPRFAPAPNTLEGALAELTQVRDELTLPVEGEEQSLRCVACAHRCLIRPGRRGICRVRFNDEGRLHVPFGYSAFGLALDPIEKKPFFHVRPGRDALSFGMLGCDMHCSYCQNWQTSQALRDERAGAPVVKLTPEEVARAATRGGAGAVVSTYNEPLITAEWAAAVFERCREQDLLTGFVSNGNATEEVLDYLAPRLDLYKIDLKGFRDATYRKLGAVLGNVLFGIESTVRRGLWVEVVTLVVPGLNDDEAELRDMARFLARLSTPPPWHLTAFHPDYRHAKGGRTPAETLARAREIGLEEGLPFVYTGNLHQGGAAESTSCPSCSALLVERRGFRTRVVELDAEAGACGRCGSAIPGRWH